MLRIRLKELLKDSGTNISELSEATGINRASLTQLADNNSKMVKFDTLDKIKLHFHLSSIYDLFADDDSANIVVQPYRMEDKSFRIDFSVNVQLTRDAKPVNQSFSTLITLKKATPSTYLLIGSLIDMKKISNFDSIQKIFFELHPMIAEHFFVRLCSQFFSGAFADPFYVGEDNGGIFSPDVCSELITQSSLDFIFSIPDLGLVTNLKFKCGGNKDKKRLLILPTPNMNNKFPKASYRDFPIYFDVQPAII